MVELLAWPVLLAYGEAAVAYAGGLGGGERPQRLAIWGVRLGWLAQTVLLVAQVVGSEGFPWSTWAGSLNLFVWFVVAVYLGWGCRPRYRLLGFVVMPPSAVLLAAAWAGGGTEVEGRARSAGVLAVHVGLMLAAFAALTVAAGVALLYLWEERRLKQRDAAVLRLRLPSLETLDRLALRIVLGGVAVLAAGTIVGAVRYGSGDFDVAVAGTLGILAVYATVLVLRFEGLISGRRFARGVVLGSLLVAAVLPLAHFAS